MQVDIYGRCGSLKCPSHLPRNSSACIDWLGKDYKFYLAFENSKCQDYITKKLTRNALGCVIGCHMSLPEASLPEPSLPEQSLSLTLTPNPNYSGSDGSRRDGCGNDGSSA